MSTELIKPEDTELAPTTTGRDVAAQLMNVIAANPTAGAENLKALLDGMERITKWQAEQEFTAAFSRLRFPPIPKAKKGHNAKYAAYEDIQEIIDPTLREQGFTLTFSSGESNAKGEIPTFGLLSHVGGHSRAGAIWLPADVTPTRGGSTIMNALQSTGSSTSYGMRYCAKMMLNLRFVGEDDDGASYGAITEPQAKLLDQAISTVGANREKFLELYGVKAVSDLPKAIYRAAQGQIEAKLRKSLQDVGADDAEIREKLAALWR
jgi:hypothetical protein